MGLVGLRKQRGLIIVSRPTVMRILAVNSVSWNLRGDGGGMSSFSIHKMFISSFMNSPLYSQVES